MKDREEQGGTGGLPSGGSGNLRSKGEKKKRRNTPEETLRDSGPQIVTRKKKCQNTRVLDDQSLFALYSKKEEGKQDSYDVTVFFLFSLEPK